ncbi:MAG TPA: C25 family cysteine peptidase, partial [Flavisolibacter sp.]|nr:C25 family cysteine peptidase [Flavisolibacter sp.]
VTPKHVFIIGKGVNYRDQRLMESASASDQITLSQLNLVPPFGAPASDALLSAEPGSSAPKTPIGRLSAISAQEVEVYLSKIKEHEQAQANMSPSAADKAWMKNVVHIVGASEPGLQAILDQYMTNYKKTISDTLFGAHVSTFTKTSSDAVESLNTTNLQDLFKEGISLITYFGHSSATTLEFNLDNPENYNNNGKYPVFIGLGCNAGNFFTYNPLRFTTKETLSERFILAPNRGTIGFIASTHFGIVHYLDIWNSRAYKELTGRGYGKTLGEVMVNTIADVFDLTTEDDFYARSNAEETALHGDPAIRINPFPKPDYVIEDPMVRVSPGFISVAEKSFKVSSGILNLGKAPNKDIVVETKRTFPDGSVMIVSRDTIPGVRYKDSVTVIVPIDPNHDKGLNKITVTVDADNAADELYESNNTVTKEVMIYEDEARPVYPYNFAIINKPVIKLTASTANPFSPVKDYKMELDTTELFNSPLKVTRTTTAAGGIMEFDPGISFKDSTVYYWRVSPIVSGGTLNWNTASFIYLANSEPGFNQSHIFQHLKSGETKLTLDSTSKTWKFGTAYQNFFIKQGSWVTSGAVQEAALSVAVNSVATIRLTCWFQSLVFNVFDATTFKPLLNRTVIPYGSDASYPLGLGLFESTDPECYGQPTKEQNFEFRYTDTSSRRKIMEFMRDRIPDNSYVIVRNFTLDESVFGGFPVAYIKDWMADTAYYGAGQSLYHYLKNAGLSSIDSFYRVRPFALVYKKGGTEPFSSKWVMGAGAYDNPTLTVDVPTSDTIGYMTSPVFGPAKAWKELKWRGASLEGGGGDNPTVNVLGITANGQVDTLYNNLNTGNQNFDLSGIDAKMYPYVQLRMRNTDTADYTPYQLRYWRLTYSPAPEGAVAPNLYFKMKDTVDIAEPINLKLAFKNISEAAFSDSIRIKAVVTDKNNVQHVIPVMKHKPLPASDTLNVTMDLDTRQLVGANSLYLEVNPDNDQVEQYRFNNFIYKTFYVRPDTLNPIMDVTFDNVHILNHDIVSSKPNVQIKIKDDAKWFLLNDTSVVNVQVRYPNNTLKNFNFNSDTMQLVPAQQAPNGDNTASINMKPYFPEDGEYELIVSGKDMSQNKAGAVQYRVAFQVINKPMISNMLNYPNPFTTSTAFVFTVTGSEVPQNIRIQILTITGKVVREITKEELGPIHIGRNITEYKWDGKDQYGQELANGVYLYRVITNLNGKSLDQYKADGDTTDKYFNKGYGKMYKMR